MAPEQFDPFSQAIMLDPYEHYRWLRDTAPVYHVPNTDIWAVSRYVDADYVLRTHAIFSSTGGVGPEWEPHPMLSMYDPPEHTRLRRLVAARFTPKFVATLAERMTASAERLMVPYVETGGGDFVTQFAEPMTSELMADVLGIPEERRGDFRRWSTGILDTLSSRHDAVAAKEAEATRVALLAYLRELIAQRQSLPPQSGIISLLLQAHEREALTPKEVLAFCVLLLVAGYETSTNALANVVNGLARHPASFEALRAEPALVASAIEEALRYDSPDQAFFRNTLSDTKIADVSVPARSKVMVLLGSANRDDAKFPDADAFDVRRDAADHLAFGSGIHYCIGAPLARQQLAIVIRALLRHAADVSPGGPGERVVTVITRGFRTLPLHVSPA